MINKHILDMITRIAFYAGRDWAETYQGHFTPDSTSHAVKLRNCKSKILEWAKHNRVVIKGEEEL